MSQGRTHLNFGADLDCLSRIWFLSLGCAVFCVTLVLAEVCGTVIFTSTGVKYL